MKIFLSLLSLAAVVWLASVSYAENTVVVIPLGSDAVQAEGNATAADVLEGVTFSNSTDIGIDGALPVRELDPESTVVQAGYYSGTTLDVVEPDLVSANIKAGTTIFGVQGNPNVVDTSSANAIATQIDIGRVAYVDGEAITGTRPVIWGCVDDGFDFHKCCSLCARSPYKGGTECVNFCGQLEILAYNGSLHLICPDFWP
jgi:hypothetical protein